MPELVDLPNLCLIPIVVCVDCGSGFHPDSSPHFERCWECAERFDIEGDAR